MNDRFPNFVRPARLTLWVLAAIVVSPVVSAQTMPLRESYWRDPAFVARFQGSYGVNSAIEPSITVAEKAIFDQIVPLLGSNPAAAIPLLQAAATPEASAAMDFTLGNVLFEVGRLEEAVVSYQRALRKFPGFLRVYQFLGKLEVRRGNFAAAMPHFVRTLELGGGNGDIYGLMGYCHLAMENSSSALVAYRQALLYQPDSLDWKRGLAQALFSAGQAREAVGVLDELIKARPDEAELWLYQANAFLTLGEMDAVAANWEAVRRLDKATPEMLAQLGDLYMNEGLPDLAFARYESALAASAGTGAKVPLRIAEILVTRGERDRAETYLAALRERFRGRLSEAEELQVLALSGSLAEARGDLEGAERAFLSIVERDPVNGPALLSLGMLYAGQQKYVEAAMRFEAAALIRGTAADALLRHGEMKVQQGRFRDGLPLLRQALQLRPSDSVRRYVEQVERAAEIAALR